MKTIKIEMLVKATDYGAESLQTIKKCPERFINFDNWPEIRHVTVTDVHVCDPAQTHPETEE